MTTPRDMMMAAAGAGAPEPTTGIFALGNVSGTGVATRNKYTFATDTSSSGACASTGSYGQSAAGNSTVGIFALGFTPTRVATRNKYTYASCSNSSATGASAASGLGSATGNSTRGIFSLGVAASVVTTRNKYTYACDSSASATAATYAAYVGSAAGNSTRGIIALGQTCPPVGSSPVPARTYRDKYTYACDTSALTTSASCQNCRGSAAGNSTRGIFALGNGNIRNRYLYACDTSTVITASSYAITGGSAAGTSKHGIFSRGGGYVCRQKFTYSTETQTSAASASATNQCGAATSNGVSGVNL